MQLNTYITYNQYELDERRKREAHRDGNTDNRSGESDVIPK